MVGVGQELTLDFTLCVAALQESLTVTAEAPVVEVTTSRVGTNVTTREIDNLPSQGRNQLSLMQLVPGLTPSLQPGTFEGGQFNANGRETGSNMFMVDGVVQQRRSPGGSQGTQARVPLDVMSEFQVLTHQYTAEFGGSSGVVVNAVTKSGTNSIRGRGYYYFQDDSLNATNYFLKLQGEENPASGSKAWGGNAGGPLVRNKAFWFGSIERNEVDNAVSLVYPPEAAPLAVSYSDTSTIRVVEHLPARRLPDDAEQQPERPLDQGGRDHRRRGLGRRAEHARSRRHRKRCRRPGVQRELDHRHRRTGRRTS